MTPQTKPVGVILTDDPNALKIFISHADALRIIRAAKSESDRTALALKFYGKRFPEIIASLRQDAPKIPLIFRAIIALGCFWMLENLWILEGFAHQLSQMENDENAFADTLKEEEDKEQRHNV